MTRLLVLALLLSSAAAAQPLKNDDEKTLYALGTILGGNLKTLGLKANELEVVKRGLMDAALGKKSLVEMDQFGPKVQQFAQKRSSEFAEGQKKASAGFLEKAAKEPGAQKLPSGLVYKQLKAGNGPTPKAEDKVKVHYAGRLIDGTEFDSSIKRGEPATFPLNGVIKCWTEGVQKMKVGEKAQLVCPSDIAYGDRGSPPKIPGGSTLIFEVELLSIEK
jgi:FKBP-type peptidyl-prolyl cis-trans isomerase FkpA